MHTHIHSPVFDKHYLVETNTIITGTTCPIDDTPLISVIEYDFSSYSCEACGANYVWGVKDLQKIREQAQRYLSMQKKELTEKKKEVATLERIIKTAESRGLLPS